MTKKIITFGEIMGRLASPDFLRLRQCHSFDVTYAGAEASVAVSIANFGGDVDYVSALPKHAIADAALDSLRSFGVNTEHVIRSDVGRLGLYFLETGANQRPSRVIYDREYSTISLTSPSAYNWDEIFKDAGWIHLSGITPALSSLAAESTLIAAKQAKSKNIKVSLDLNFRKNLWKWSKSKTSQELAKETMSKILPYIDVLIANEEDCSDVLDIKADNTVVSKGAIDATKYTQVAKSVCSKFNTISTVAITLRESHSATYNSWGAMLYDHKTDRSYFSPLDQDKYSPYEIRSIVDRVGGGDAFAAGLIYAFKSDEYKDNQNILNFAIAASALKHSIKGDFNYSTKQEVEALMKGSSSGRVIR